MLKSKTPFAIVAVLAFVHLASATFVSSNGQLRASGTKIVNDVGSPIVLRGVSLYHSQNLSKYWNHDTIAWLVSDWHINVIRAPVSATADGYILNPTQEYDKLAAVIQSAINLGIYVIVDWHGSSSQSYQSEAIAFFRKVAQEFGSYPNVMFEVWNTHTTYQTWASSMKTFYDQVILAVREYTENLFIAGTIYWTQQGMDVAPAQPLEPGKYKNIAYSLEFFAGTDTQTYRELVQKVIYKGITLLATVGSLSESSGTGTVSVTEFDSWIDFLETNKIGWIIWSIADLPDTSSALVEGASESGNWASGDLTTSGSAAREKIRSLNSASSDGTSTTSTTTSATTTGSATTASSCTATVTRTVTATSVSTKVSISISTTTVFATKTVSTTRISTTTSSYTTTATRTVTATSTSASVSTVTKTATITTTKGTTSTITKTATTTQPCSSSPTTTTTTSTTSSTTASTSTSTSTPTSSTTTTTTTTATSTSSSATPTSTSTTTTTITTTTTTIPPANPCPVSPVGFVAKNGQLKTVGNKIVNKDNVITVLRGVSLFWSQWMGQFYNYNVVSTLVNDWNITVIRAAMGVEMGGYLTNPDLEKQKVVNVIEAALSLGIYVIIDWHDHNANQHQNQAITFFTDIAHTYGNCPNVIFEVFNEPEWQSWNSVIKPYHEALVSSIRTKSQNLILLGSSNWSQKLDEVANNPLDSTSYTNIAYTVHFFAATHKQWLRDLVQLAINKNLPVFASNSGPSESSGDGYVDTSEFGTWLSFLESNFISWVVWAVDDKAESSAALKPGVSSNGGWNPSSDLTTAGQLVRNEIRNRNGASTTPTITTTTTSSTTASTTTSSSSASTTSPTSTTTSTSTSTSTTTSTLVPDYTPNSKPCPKPAVGFAAAHGQLRTSGKMIVDIHNQPVILRGISLFWSQWYGQFWNYGVVNTLVKDWHVTVVRAALAVEMGGYLENAATERQKVINVIEAALDLGVYVIVDWHDHNANSHQNQAKTFFTDIADLYGNCPNVIFEPFNEPEWQDWNSVIKPYHQALVSTIRTKSQNLVLLGSRMWDQRLDEVAANPLDSSVYKNIAYTVHFYAASHRQWNRDLVQVAIDKNLPILASECGLSEASGAGNIDVNEFNNWVTFLESNYIGWAVWSLADKAESSAMLNPGASTIGAWTTNNYSPAGLATYNLIRSKQ